MYSLVNVSPVGLIEKETGGAKEPISKSDSADVELARLGADKSTDNADVNDIIVNFFIFPPY